jgi:hypothetical protein
MMRDPLIDEIEQADRHIEARRRALERFPIQKIGQIQLRAPKWLGYHAIEEGAIGAIIGESGAGKSFVVLSLALAIATGREWNSKPTIQGPVLYIAGEGREGIIRRVRAWAIANQVEISSVQLYIAPGVNLTDPEAMHQVGLALEEIAEMTAPKLIIADTWATSLQADENSVSDTSKGLAALADLAAPYHAAVLIVHHVGHGDKGRARGSSALHAAMDVVHLVERRDDGILQVSNVKSKDTELAAPLAFQLQTVPLGIKDDLGEEVVSACLKPVEFTPEKGSNASGKWQRLSLDTLRDLTERHRKNLEGKGLDPENARVLETDWRTAAYDAGIPKNRFSEAKKSFQQSGVIIMEGSYVILP